MIPFLLGLVRIGILAVIIGSSQALAALPMPRDGVRKEVQAAARVQQEGGLRVVAWNTTLPVDSYKILLPKRFDTHPKDVCRYLRISNRNTTIVSGSSS